MNLRSAARFSGVVLAAASVVALAKPAAAQKDGIERWLANIKVNASSKAVLALFGNPNDIQIGDTPVRPPSSAGGGQTGGMQGGMGGGAMMGGMSGSMGGMSGGMSLPSGSGLSLPGGGNKGGGGSAPPMMGGMSGSMSGMSGSMGGMMGRGSGGPMMGSQGGPMMGGGGKGGMMAGGGGDDLPGMGGGGGAMMGSGGRGGMMGGGMMGGGMMGGGGGIGGFGQTNSSSTPQEEITWIYNTQARDVKGQKQAISYEFLISPEGKVSQIRVTGYVPKTKYDKSAKGITLGSTFKDLIGRYGSPKSVLKQGDLLVCSYPDQHIEFQLMNMRSVNGYADPYKGVFKVIAIQINAVE